MANVNKPNDPRDPGAQPDPTIEPPLNADPRLTDPAADPRYAREPRVTNNVVASGGGRGGILLAAVVAVLVVIAVIAFVGPSQDPGTTASIQNDQPAATEGATGDTAAPQADADKAPVLPGNDEGGDNASAAAPTETAPAEPAPAN